MNGNKRQRTNSDAVASSDRGSERPEKAAKPLLTRACAECKRQKIRCFFAAGQSACNKCSKSGIQCVPHNFAQKYMDDDAIWKAEATETISRLTAAVNYLLEQNNMPKLATFGKGDKALSANDHPTTRENGNATSPTATGDATTAVQSVSPAMSQASSTAVAATTAASGNFISEGPSAELQEDDSDLVPLPMNNLYNLTDPSKSYLIRVDPTCVNGPDFISRGVVSLEEAQFLFSHFITHINPLLWDGILCAHTTLEAARASSSLLVATVLTVAAMHLSGERKDTANAPDTDRQNGNQNDQQRQQHQQQQQQQRQNKPTLLHATYDAFVQLMRASCLLRSQNLDDIRGLCIGAFYLTSLSWALCSRAIRVATEMNVHKSSLQFAARGVARPTSSTSSPSMPGQPSSSSYGNDQFERVQLWYVLYVCDHQFALAYGRPPSMHDDASIRNADKLLAMSESLSFPSDVPGPIPPPVSRNARGNRWLVAQVKLFRILAGAYFLYGCDPDLALSGEDYQRLQSFNLSLDQWRLEEQQQHTRGGGGGGSGPMGVLPVGLTGDWPSRGYPTDDRQAVSNKVTTLYYHLARFQLNSLSLRGISARGNDGGMGAGQFGTTVGTAAISMSWERQEAANNAIAAAASTIRLIVEDADLRSLQIGMPIFVHAMIAVCASFLLKMAVVFNADSSNNGRAALPLSALPLPRDLSRHGLNFHTKNALADVESLVRVLGAVADSTSQQHVVRQVVTGLRELLQRFRPGSEPDTFVYLRSTIQGVVHNGAQNGNSVQSGVPGGTVPANSGAFDYANNEIPRTAPPAYSMTPHGNGGLPMHPNTSHAGHQQGHDQQTMSGSDGNMGGFNVGNGANANNGVPYAALPQGQMPSDSVMQPSAALAYQDDPFNLMGDLDWRFNDAFLWGIQAEPPYA
ncbi:hypothetical protein Sste5346_006166 [Sporothrix stenoceras]|uniref:Zn(2)-C6 fungal-type domain-containing protein n=1 Tax=Sporothrix stenoceras TaxID=5173 RepID=A0ABR3Z067_9PEZI